MKSVTLRPAGPLRGETSVPGDKSISHRALILSSQSRTECTINGLSRGRDVLDTCRTLRALGVTVSNWEDEPVSVAGVGAGGWSEPEGVLDFGNSGTGLRLMAGLLAAHPFFCVLSGDRYLRRRPMMRIVEPLRLMGAGIEGRQGGKFPPLAVMGHNLQGITYRTPVASAQVKSAVLLAGLLAGGRTEVTEPSLSRDHTERMLCHLGAAVERSGTQVSLRGPQQLEGREIAVPGDPSAAAFLLAAALIVPDSEVTVRNICVNPTRTGFFDILRDMEADITFANEQEKSGEPVADVTARTSTLTGTEISPDMVPRTIDEFPVLSVLALFARGKTVFSGAEELRFKESDRISSMAAELSRLGGRVLERPDGLEITGGASLSGADCHSRGDHRVAMALAVAGCAIKDVVTVADTACVNTSFPGFWSTLNNLGGSSDLHGEQSEESSADGEGC